MPRPALPNWVYDLVIDLIQHEDHPKLLFTSGGFQGTAQYDWCPCSALEKVPADVVAHARVLNDYLESAPETSPDQDSTDTATKPTGGEPS